MIRLMNNDDYEEVFKLWLKLDGLGLRPLDDSKDGIKKFLRKNPDTCFVCLRDGKIVGVILGGSDGRRGMIYHLAVCEEYSRHGIGSKLVNECIKAFYRNGIHKVGLHVYADNENAHSFWHRQGFSLRSDIQYFDYEINIEDYNEN